MAAEGWDVGYAFEKIVQAGHDYLDTGETACIGDSSGFGACNQMCDGDEIKAFWDNWSTYARRPLDGDEDLIRSTGDPFSCCV